MGRYIKYLTKQYTRTYTRIHTYCTHNRWWLVLGWVTTKEDRPRLYSLNCDYMACYKCN